MDIEPKIIVMDFGTSEIRIGFAGEAQPQVQIPAVINKYRSNEYRSTESIISRWGLQFDYPIVGRKIEHWESLVEVLRQVFNEELQINPEEYRIILTEPLMVHQDYYGKLIKILFETFNIQGFTVSNQAILTLFQMNHSAGVVIDIGEGYTSIDPIIEGFPISNPFFWNDISGWAITNYLQRLLTRHYPNLSYLRNHEIIQEIKENYCYIAQNYPRELQIAEKSGEKFKKQYELPNRQTISVGFERFYAPECIFNPSSMGLYDLGLHVTLVQSIMGCPSEFHPELFANIILTGGSSQLPGLSQRLYKEITRGPIIVRPKVRGRKSKLYQLPSDVNVTIHLHPKPSLSSWLGGSKLGMILARNSAELGNMWITQKEYQQRGIRLVHECLSNISQLISEQLR